ncbi:AraC family transcriptional regulator [Dickeya dadantii]|uniref:helix-turn-helix domain-containing protein n=1 Tax=Dickeya dadantii TaxID=204038 RepID=UPI001C0BD901|nr:AraC family transcriptional regulator [Dickeya dadantii]MCA7014349.1 AraC family transcriptional regulator [Dickeya dadantii]QWT40403.1 AraC family transcriptional regulator [Dickeya dadantii]
MDELKHQDDVLCIECIIDSASALESLPHRHGQGKFVLIRQGVFCIHTTFRNWLIKPGIAVWIPPNVVHWGQACHRVELTMLYASQTLCHSIANDIKLLDASPLLTGLCERLMSPHTPLSDERRSRILQLLFEEIADMPTSSLSLPLPGDQRLKKITDSLIATPALRRSLAEWGTQVGATERTLARLFVRHTGLRFTEWHNRLLLSDAWQGLADNKSNNELAIQLGFSSSDSLGHWFKRMTGFSPSHARKHLNRQNKFYT